MKFSVIVPLYNGAQFIEKTLDSVLAQTYKGYEVILINDGSPDNVGEVVKNYIFKYPNTKFVYIEQENKGLGGARNTALKHSSGEIIAVLDQDDIWYPEKLQKMAKAYEADPSAAVVCHNHNVQEDGKIVAFWQTGPYQKEMHRKLVFEGNCLSTLASTFKKSLIKDVGYFSEDRDMLHFLEDYEFWMRIALNDYKFIFMPDILAEYVIHESNYSLANLESMCKNELYVINLHYSLLKKKRIFDWYRIRKRRSLLFLRTVRKLFWEAKSPFRAIYYLFKMFGSDPFYILTFVARALRKVKRIITKKR